MNKRIYESIKGGYHSRFMPFLWYRGESREEVYAEILAIKSSGIDMICVESKSYKEFCREAWWDIFGFILESAKNLGMKVWLLDDQRFPTGYAAGALGREENSELRGKLIRERQADIVGPARGASIFTDPWLREGESIERVVAYRHIGNDEELDPDSAIDLTCLLNNGRIYWNVPDGVWRVCITINTLAQYSCVLKKQIDMLNERSCELMISEIYQPHYEHFSEYFGNVFCGFFSDEPGFLNGDGYQITTGLMYENYPYSPELAAEMAEISGVEKKEIELYLPALWEKLGDKSAMVRWAYMEAVTRKVRKNFSMKLSEWCHEHGVMYIGHIVEDMNAHMRMGYSIGHFFRSLDGCDMSGIDTVLFQNVPGFTDCAHRAPLANKGYAHPRFFHYTLPKLGASHAHLQPRKQGRAMCEMFGAYGWSEGLPYMKNLADLMLASGINYFVPHAFSPEKDDREFPPHFYNGGEHPQYPLFGELVKYMSRTAHSMSDGIHVADVAVFYNCDGEWTGGKNKTFDSVCMELTRSLIDFDIVPIDMLTDAEVNDGRLCINGESFGALIVSESEIMPRKALETFRKLAERGLPIVFTDSLPEKCEDGKDADEFNGDFISVSEKALAELLRERELCSVLPVSGDSTYLRYYHKKTDSGDIYMLLNEDVKRTLSASIYIGISGEYMIYKADTNECFRSKAENGIVDLRLDRGEAIIVSFGEEIPENTPDLPVLGARKPLDIVFDITAVDSATGKAVLEVKDSQLIDVTAPENLPLFCGTVEYSGSFSIDGEYRWLDLGEVGETAELWMNGQYIGAKIAPPYRFDISSALLKGKNSLRIKACGSPAHKLRDKYSAYFMTPPTGVLGPIELVGEE